MDTNVFHLACDSDRARCRDFLPEDSEGNKDRIWIEKTSLSLLASVEYEIYPPTASRWRLPTIVNFCGMPSRILRAKNAIENNSPQCRGFECRVIGHGKWSAASVRILAHHGNVFALARAISKPSIRNARSTFSFRASTGNFMPS
jgi:hypothetical protein